MKKLRSSEIIYIPDIEDLSKEEASEKSVLKKMNLKSVITVPLFYEGRLFGFIGVGYIKDKTAFSKELLKIKILIIVVKRGKASPKWVSMRPKLLVIRKAGMIVV